MEITNRERLYLLKLVNKGWQEASQTRTSLAKLELILTLQNKLKEK